MRSVPTEQERKMHRGVVAYTLRLGVLAAWVLAVCACGGGAKPLSGEYSLSPGRYVANDFEPALSFEVGKGWEYGELRQKPYFDLSWENEGYDHFVIISFNNPPSKVSDPTNPDKLVPAPNDWVSWLQRHPHLDTSEPHPTSIGGVQGMRFDTVVSPLPKGYYGEDCGGAGVPLWPLLRGHHWCADEGFTSRTFVLDGVEGETVVIDVWSSSETFEKVVPEAKQVLDTVEWEGA
jgi:hypothetical protein